VKASKIIGVSGGSGSGKTTLAKKIQRALGAENCTVLSQDNYYHDQSSKFDVDGGKVNFDHPSSLDFDLMATHLRMLKKGHAIQVPLYDFATHSRLADTMIMEPHNVIILDGILILSQPQIRELLDISIFVDIVEEIRFQRRLKRDIEERGRTREGVTAQFMNQVKPMHDMFVETSKKFADYLAHDDFNVTSFLETEKLIYAKSSAPLFSML
jgi:uridine kinase